MSRPGRIPEQIVPKLLQVGFQLEAHQLDAGLVSEIVNDLSTLPSQSVISVAAALSGMNGLFWRNPPSPPAPEVYWARRLFGLSVPGPHTSPRSPADWRRRHMALLAGTPKLEFLFLFHPNGHIREAALDKLTDIPSPFFVSALALRLNDWAFEVRGAARRCVDRTLQKTSAAVVAEAALYLLKQSREWARGQQDVRLLDEVFARPDVTEALIGLVLTEQDGRVTRALDFALVSDVLDDRLQTIAREALSPAVRAIALRTLIDGEARRRIGYNRQWIDKTFNLARRVPRVETRAIVRPISMFDALAMAAVDRSAVVRRTAAEAIVRHRRELSNVAALLDLLRDDSSPSVLQRVRFVADDLGLEIDDASRSKDP